MRNNEFENCCLCPRSCKVNRQTDQKGFCMESSKLRLARAALHFYEEPVISGTKGSGAVFFCGCNLRCVYCQNREIALGTVGREISIERLCEIFFELKEQGANNINLVTPTHFIPAIREAIIQAKSRGFNLPFVYNTSSYETVEALKTLDGLIDIYLPDFKYMDALLARNYSHAPDYPTIAKKAIAEMVRQTGPLSINPDTGLMEKGVIVRHMVLPNGTKNAKNVISYLFETYRDSIYISIMNQYTPMKEFDKFPELSRKVTAREYQRVIDYTVDLGVINAFIQEGETASESFIPVFNFKGV
ncbi:MAG: radical SAM protein [Lachnospiraceae bacterium]|nr:radical SAM protein [Lachnospiraceae bacterium]